MANGRNKPTHMTRGNVLDDLGFAPEQATALKFKADLYQAILKHARKYSQKQLQAILESLNPMSANYSMERSPTRAWTSCSTTPAASGSKPRADSRRPIRTLFARNGGCGAVRPSNPHRPRR